ncbi:MAG: hypothetical protein ACK5BG_18980, partial [Pseudanabaena sp.]
IKQNKDKQPKKKTQNLVGRGAPPPLIFWVLCPKQNLHCYMSEDSEDEEFPDEDTLRDKVS